LIIFTSASTFHGTLRVVDNTLNFIPFFIIFR